MGIDYSYLEEVDMAAEICNLREVWVMPSTNETLSPWGEATSRRLLRRTDGNRLFIS
jgi:hypothetical protein